MSTRMVEVRAKVMKQNDLLARTLRERFEAAGVCVIGLVSSPGSGKTAFLEKLLAGLAQTSQSPRWSAISQPKTTPPVSCAPRPTSARSLQAPSAISTPR